MKGDKLAKIFAGAKTQFQRLDDMFGKDDDVSGDDMTTKSLFGGKEKDEIARLEAEAAAKAEEQKKKTTMMLIVGGVLLVVLMFGKKLMK